MKMESIKKSTNILDEFVNVASKHKLWYSLDNHSLLWWKMNKDKKYEENKICLLINIDTYEKLSSLFPGRIFDSFTSKKCKDLKINFVTPDFINFGDNQFIEMRLLIPTTYKNIQKFFSKFSIIKRFLTNSKTDIRSAIGYLYTETNDGYFLTNSKNTIKRNDWINVIDFELMNIEFNKTQVSVVTNHNLLLTSWFGNGIDDLANFQKYLYPNPTLKTKKEIN